MILLNNVTVAGPSKAVYSTEMRDGTIAFAATGLSVGEEVVVEFSIDGGNSWHQIFQYGVTIKLTSTNNVIGCYAPLNIRVNLTSVPVNPVTVIVAQLSQV